MIAEDTLINDNNHGNDGDAESKRLMVQFHVNE